MDQITQVCYRALPLFFLQWADECDEYIWGGGGWRCYVGYQHSKHTAKHEIFVAVKWR